MGRVSIAKDAELTGVLESTLVGGNVEDKASLGLVVGAESESVPMTPTLLLVVCTSEALLAVLAAASSVEEAGVVTVGADEESVGDTETTPLELVD